jgi:glutamine amidotransferase
MGWCATSRTSDHSLLDNISDGSHFYYLHSYALPFCDYTVATAEHAKPFSAVIGRDNFVATQFHPERSSAAGAQLLRNFLDGSS